MQNHVALLAAVAAMRACAAVIDAEGALICAMMRAQARDIEAAADKISVAAMRAEAAGAKEH